MRTVLHVDLNNFYASVETIIDPSLKGDFLGVTGNIESRHGVILAKSESAKKAGVKTGMTVHEALKICPELKLVEAKHDRYVKYSEIVRNIYRRYTDVIEPFGIDECWLDCTSTVKMFGGGEKIANDIRETVKRETGLTVSVGVSFNKVFAKLGSDMKKPDAVTVISPENFKEKVWGLPVENLLFVGKSTLEKLKKYNIATIGDLAAVDEKFLTDKFGKWGATLKIYAEGLDDTPVMKDNESDEIKSVGNSITSYRDLVNMEDAKLVFSVLAASVSRRLISYNIGKACGISVYVRDNELNSITRSARLPYPTVLADDFCAAAEKLLENSYDFKKPIRTLGLTVSGFTEKSYEQLTVYDKEYRKKLSLQLAVNAINEKYGKKSVMKGIVYKDKKLLGAEPSENGIVKQNLSEQTENNSK